MQYGTVQYRKVQYSTVQYSKVQYLKNEFYEQWLGKYSKIISKNQNSTFLVVFKMGFSLELKRRLRVLMMIKEKNHK